MVKGGPVSQNNHRAEWPTEQQTLPAHSRLGYDWQALKDSNMYNYPTVTNALNHIVHYSLSVVIPVIFAGCHPFIFGWSMGTDRNLHLLKARSRMYTQIVLRHVSFSALTRKQCHWDCVHESALCGPRLHSFPRALAAQVCATHLRRHNLRDL